MSDYTVLRADEAPDYSGDDAPGAFLGYANPMGSEELGLNIRVLEAGQANVPPGLDETGGHSHEGGPEEIYFVLDGEVTFKLGDDVVKLGPRDAVRIPAGVIRHTRNESDGPATVLMVSQKMSDPKGQSQFHDKFWDQDD